MRLGPMWPSLMARENRLKIIKKGSIGNVESKGSKEILSINAVPGWLEDCLTCIEQCQSSTSIVRCWGSTRYHLRRRTGFRWGSEASILRDLTILAGAKSADHASKLEIQRMELPIR